LTAKTGIYKNILDEVKQIISSNNLNEAEKLLNQASEYRKTNNLNENPLFIQLSIELKQKQYDQLIADGTQKLNSSNFVEALKAFDSAVNIEKTIDITKNKSLPVSIAKAAKSQIGIEVKSGELQVESNRLSDARLNYQNAKKYQEKYSLFQDAEVNKLMTQLKSKIFTQECKNAQNEYEKIIADALSLAERKLFIDEEKTLEKAVKKAEENKDCDISTESASNERSRVLPAITYQKLLASIEGLIVVGKYDEVIKKYREAEEHFFDLNVSKFGLNHDALPDFIKKSNNDFIDFAVKYFTDLKDYENALLMLNELQKRNNNPKWQKNNMILLGTQLAIRDKQQNPTALSKQLVLKYTNNNSWFNSLKKAYLKQWKN
jgi:hypothetical protein